VAEASRFESHISVVFKDKQMDGKSILGLLLLAAPCGGSIQVCAEGRDEKEAIRALSSLVSAGFGEVQKA
jgi:phosphocarrier protein